MLFTAKIRRWRIPTIRFLFCLIFSAIILSVFIPVTASADGGSWIGEEEKEDLYGNDDNMTTLTDPEEEEEPGAIMSMFLSLLNDFNAGVQKAFDSIGLSFSVIVQGRINGNGVEDGNGIRIAPYTFELADGNPYGIVSMAVYNVIRSVMFIFMACVIMFRFTHALWISNTSRAVSAVKESIGGMALGFLFLLTMPYLLDMAIYIKDVILFAILEMGTDTLGLASVNPTKTFAKIVEDNPTLVNELMYIGSFVLVIYFALQYVGVALNFVVHVIAFPFVCIMMQFDKKALGTWGKNILGYLMIPITDTCLLFIPAVFGLIGDSAAVAIVQFIVCTMLLPARSALRSALGIQPSSASELSGIATMLGVGRLAGALTGNTVGAVAKGISGLKEAGESSKKADMYSDFANAENGIAPEMRGASAFKLDMEDGYKNAKAGGMDDFGAFTAGVGHATAQRVKSGLGGMAHAGKTVQNAMQGTLGNYQSSVMNDRKIASVTAADGMATDTVMNNNDIGSDMQSMATGISGTGAGAVELGNMDLRQRVLNKYANKDNLESPEFSNLSASRKAELYRERAKAQRHKAISSMVGNLAGAGAGAVAGLGMSAFLSPASSAMLTAEMMNLGGAAGSVTGSALGGLTYSAAYGVRTAGSMAAHRNDGLNIMSGAVHGADVEMGIPPTYSGTVDIEAPAVYGSGEVSAAARRVYGTARSETDAYNQAFYKANAVNMAQATMNTFRWEKGSQAYDSLHSVYRTHPDSYSTFRDEASRVLSSNLAENISNLAVSGGDVAKDNDAISQKVQEFQNNVLNPRDTEGKQISLSANHPLSRESLAAKGFFFDD